MCVAGLNVSTQPCNHRWYQLVRACHPANNLANCPERLRLEGWETRVDFCPFCTHGAAQMISESTHRLFGSTSSSASVASSSSNSSDVVGATRYRRSGSSGTISTLSRQSSMGSGVGVEPEIDRGQMHREMNDRLLLYLTSDPHQVLPSAKKNYPTYTATAESSSASDAASIISNANGLFSRNWTKGVRFSKNIFKT